MTKTCCCCDGNIDYLFMDIDYEVNRPDCLEFIELKEEKGCFSIEWMEQELAVRNLRRDQVLVVMSDGSVKDEVGGSGFVIVEYEIYGMMSIDNALNYVHGANPVAIRCSIDYCELDGLSEAVSLYLETWA